jgi:enoyl-CoA hydratase/carnithine racemase
VRPPNDADRQRSESCAWQTALGADLRVVAHSASVEFLFTKVGLSGADMGIAYLLPRIVGVACNGDAHAP